MARFHTARTASIGITLFGASVNLALAVNILSGWRSLKWLPESEWEGSGDTWRVDGIKLVWALLSVYFASATAVCFVGFLGTVKSIPSFVRFYRDYSIADFSFCAFFTLAGTYAAFYSSVRTAVCEQLSRQPELMRDMAEMGLNLENCELWFERVVLASMGVMVVLIVVRLHFLIAVSNFYSLLLRHSGSGLPLHMPSRSHSRDESLQRIYLLPRTAISRSRVSSPSPSDDVIVYAPVPLSSLSPQEHASAAEAWVSRTEPLSSSPTGRSHRHRHHGSSGSTGRISLPVLPDEGLLPSYEEGKGTFRA